jgi:hypothetical protein
VSAGELEAQKKLVRGPRALRTRVPPCDGKVANCRDFRGFGWGIAHGAVSRRPPISLYTTVPGATRTTLGFGICPSFKGHFLSRRAKP